MQVSSSQINNICLARALVEGLGSNPGRDMSISGWFFRGWREVSGQISPQHLDRVLLVQVKNLLEPLYCTLLQAPAGGPTDQPFTNKAGSTEAFLEKDRNSFPDP